VLHIVIAMSVHPARCTYVSPTRSHKYLICYLLRPSAYCRPIHDAVSFTELFAGEFLRCVCMLVCLSSILICTH